MPQSQIGGVLSLLGMMLVFILVLVLAWMVTRYLGRHYAMQGQKGNHIELLERTMLGPDRALFIVRVAGKVLLLGVTAQQIEKLEELPAEEFDAAEPKMSLDVSAPFSQALGKALENWGIRQKKEKGSQDG